MKLPQQSVAVLGASGFVGHAVAKHLENEGARVVLAARSLDTAFDLRDPNSIARVAEGCTKAVIAAGSSPHESLASEEYGWLHVAGIENAIHGLRHAGVQHIVMVSDADAQLHNGSRMNWDETRQVPAYAKVSARSRALRLSEEIALSASNDELSIVLVKPIHVWGPGDSKRARNLKLEAQSELLLPSKPVIYASTYIDHVTRAVAAALQRPHLGGRAFSIADSTFQTSEEFFVQLAEALAIPRGIRRASWVTSWGLSESLRDELWRRTHSSSPNIQAAVRELEYTPHVSIAQALRDTADWARNTARE